MIARDCRPGSPPDGTVRADRRSRDPLGPAPAWAAEEAVGRRAGLPGRGPGAAGRPVRTPLAAQYCGDARLGHLFPDPPHQPERHKRLKAAAPLLAAVLDYGRERPVLARPGPADRRHPTAVRELAGDRQAVRGSAGWAGYGYCAAHSRWRYRGLKLYLITTPDGMPAAWCLASPKLGEREVAAELWRRRAYRRTAAGTDPDRRQGLRRAGLRGPGHHRVRPETGSPGPPRRGSPPRIHRLDPPVDRIGERHPQGPARPGTPRWPHPGRRLRPHHPAAARHGRRHLAQLGCRRTRPAGR